MKLGNFCIDTEISSMLLQIMYKLWHFKIVKIGQNLHANMKGFCRAGHIYSGRSIKNRQALSNARQCRKTLMTHACTYQDMQLCICEGDNRNSRYINRIIVMIKDK